MAQAQGGARRYRSLLSLEEAWGTIAEALVARKLNIKVAHAAGRQLSANRREFAGVVARQRIKEDKRSSPDWREADLTTDEHWTCADLGVGSAVLWRDPSP